MKENDDFIVEGLEPLTFPEIPELTLPEIPELEFTMLPEAEAGEGTSKRRKRKARKNETQQPEEGVREELTEYGRDFVEERMMELSRYAAKQGRMIFAYEDAAVSFANFGPFDPRGVEVFRRKMEMDKPWGFFIGGKGCPQALKGKDKENVAKALGMSFPADVLKTAVEIAGNVKTSAAAEVSTKGAVEHG